MPARFSFSAMKRPATPAPTTTTRNLRSAIGASQYPFAAPEHPRSGLLRFARNDIVSSCHCEERSDEAISQEQDASVRFAPLTSMTLTTRIANLPRAAMGSRNRLKLGLFGANCSSGRAVTMVPERWSGSWPDCVALAQMADRAGIEFMLPIGRWKGYGGATDYQGATLETVTWAAGLLAGTERLTVFGTVHAPLVLPLIAA